MFDSGVQIAGKRFTRRRGEEKVNHRGTEDTEIKPARECAQNLPQCPPCLCVESLSPRLRASACPFLEKTSGNARLSCFPRTAPPRLGEERCARHTPLFHRPKSKSRLTNVSTRKSRRLVFCFEHRGYFGGCTFSDDPWSP